jgi:hypothetical protein
MKYSEFLDRRLPTSLKAFECINQRIDPERTYNIVELGTSRSYASWRIETNPAFWFPDNPERWPWSDGFFTRLMADNLEGKNFRLWTVDPNPDACIVARTCCGNNERVSVVQDYSTNFLNSVDFKIDFLYMDHLESGEDACRKHLEDAKLVVEKKLMRDNALIMVDDTEVGEKPSYVKGRDSIPYLESHGFTKVLHGYQVLLDSK